VRVVDASFLEGGHDALEQLAERCEFFLFSSRSFEGCVYGMGRCIPACCPAVVDHDAGAMSAEQLSHTQGALNFPDQRSPACELQGGLDVLKLHLQHAVRDGPIATCKVGASVDVSVERAPCPAVVIQGLKQGFLVPVVIFYGKGRDPQAAA
jgi:hypothetical protein